MIIKRVVVGSLETNCYILGSRRNNEAIVIDPGGDFSKIISVVKKNNLTLKFVVNTHAHEDHIAANDEFGVPVLIHKDDQSFLTNSGLNLSAFFSRPLVLNAAYRLLSDGDRISVGEITLEVIHTPGHTPGSICLKKEAECPVGTERPVGKDFVFTGDTLFCGGVGRTDFPYGSQELLLKSINEKLLTLDDRMVIYPGHGPTSTIGREKESNPFLR